MFEKNNLKDKGGLLRIKINLMKVGRKIEQILQELINHLCSKKKVEL